MEPVVIFTPSLKQEDFLETIYTYYDYGHQLTDDEFENLKTHLNR